jgi:hypothetical protein
MKKSINFLIAAIIPTLAGLIYMLFEDDLLQLLASLPQNTNQRIILRTALLSVILLILGMSYLILEFRSKYIAEKKNSEAQSFPKATFSSIQRLFPNAGKELSTQPHPAPEKPKVEYITVDDYKWKATIYSNGTFEVDKYPICTKHDLVFWYDSLSLSYKCPERDKKNCYNEFSYIKHEKIYDTAKSYIEKEIRNNPSLAPAKEKPLEAASASSEPGPTDYHAPRRRLPPDVW